MASIQNLFTVGKLGYEKCCIDSTTGWCKSRGTVLFLSSAKTEMTDTIEIGHKIFPKPLPNQIYIIL